MGEGEGEIEGLERLLQESNRLLQSVRGFEHG